MKLSHLSLLFVLFTPALALALDSDTEQPVYVDADSQQVDMQSNKATFIGNVKLKQGSININADKVVVERDPKDSTIRRIEGYGNLATFSQLSEDGKTLYGEAKELYYVMVDDQLTMIDQAMLSQDDSVIRGSKITYNISSQKLIADGKQQGDRVSTVLQPQSTQE
ncbi:lipopolysaccharide transport periplasmic protein LptA [Vibrio caribbeanicus]|uniref:lipopolysaccharide transport periplasmic protein LptA n=1 Tax=Vibrio caribbeanicus TaxID=701175 RepID=UPI0022843A0D|nr:lipopolysaccharide transport periplasmic protein LptA [Vibrio caribbeanicus]MCY9846332.1 lipopolysaccharide transport periplasmic protein LptA [Vibrio caribbeanicus]